MAEQEILEYRSESERYLPVDLLSYRAGALIASLQTVEDGVELAWMYRQGDLRKKYHGHLIFHTGLWGRSGWFYQNKETFVDYFDRTSYETGVWKFASSFEMTGAFPALELHPGTDAPKGACVLLTAGDLKRFLGTVDPDTKLLAPSRNFELRGSLVDEDGVFMYLGQDIKGKDYLFLRLDT